MTPRSWDARVAHARRAAHALLGLVAFLVESACVGNGLFWFLTWSALGFDWTITARAYAGFWTHYVAAAPAARQPVELTVLVALSLLTALAIAVRAPRGALRRGRTSTRLPEEAAP